jgi:predicted lactoylglutathione lyase
MMFVNLPVADLQASVAFFTQLGFTFNPMFTDHTATCMVIGEQNFAMLLTREKFAGFAPHPIADARQTTEVLVCLSCTSRAEVDTLVAKAVAAGGNTYNSPQDHGFMYGHGFQDLDGHVWELAWMDMAAASQQLPQPE